MPTAPTAASVISTFMSSEPRRSPARAERAIDQPPTAIDARYRGSATARDAPDSEATTAAASSTSDPDTETVRASRRQNGAAGSTPPTRQRRRAIARARDGGRHTVGLDVTVDGQRRVAERHLRRAHPVECRHDFLDRLRARRAIHALHAVARRLRTRLDGRPAQAARRGPSAASAARSRHDRLGQHRIDEQATRLGQRVHHHLAVAPRAHQPRSTQQRARGERPVSQSAQRPRRGRIRTAPRRRHAARLPTSGAWGPPAPSPAPPRLRLSRAPGARGAALRPSARPGTAGHRCRPCPDILTGIRAFQGGTNAQSRTSTAPARAMLSANGEP